MTTPPLFAFDSSRQALIFELAPGQGMGIQVGNLRAAGWTGTEADYRAALPRCGQPVLHQAPDMAAARAFARTLDRLPR